MMNVTYDLGMDSASVYFAKSAYRQNGDVSYIAFATETCIGADDDGGTVECAELLMKDDKFFSYAQSKDEKLNVSYGSYKKFVCTNYALACYDVNDKEKAITFVKSVSGTAYAADEPLVALFVYAIGKEDGETVRSLHGAVSALSASGENAVRLQNLLVLAAPYLH